MCDNPDRVYQSVPADTAEQQVAQGYGVSHPTPNIIRDVDQDSSNLYPLSSTMLSPLAQMLGCRQFTTKQEWNNTVNIISIIHFKAPIRHVMRLTKRQQPISFLRQQLTTPSDFRLSIAVAIKCCFLPRNHAKKGIRNPPRHTSNPQKQRKSLAVHGK